MKRRPNIPEFQRDLLERIRTEGAEAAYQASLAICRDPKAPSPARATASSTLFRVGGYFDGPEIAQPKEAHEMSYEETQVAIERLRDILQTRGISRGREDNDDDEDDEDDGDPDIGDPDIFE